MITIKELRKRSQEWGIPIENVDKDWVLGHFLNGMYEDRFIRENFVFKGGTCLRKIYFENYRFSEDLDFTVTEKIKRSEISQKLESIADNIYQNIGISFGPFQCKDLLFNDRLMGYEFRIPFWGALHPKQKKIESRRWTTSIRVDISLKEPLLKDVVSRKLLHPYPDQDLMNSEIHGYCLEEIYSEKLRSLLQRSYGAPRDYYDLWCIAKKYSPEVKWEEIPSLFEKKCSVKKIQVDGIDVFFNPQRVGSVTSEWKPSLGGHLSKLPEVDLVMVELKEIIETILS